MVYCPLWRRLHVALSLASGRSPGHPGRVRCPLPPGPLSLQVPSERPQDLCVCSPPLPGCSCSPAYPRLCQCVLFPAAPDHCRSPQNPFASLLTPFGPVDKSGPHSRVTCASPSHPGDFPLRRLPGLSSHCWGSKRSAPAPSPVAISPTQLVAALTAPYRPGGCFPADQGSLQSTAPPTRHRTGRRRPRNLVI